jgi:hypothetical protein
MIRFSGSRSFFLKFSLLTMIWGFFWSLALTHGASVTPTPSISQGLVIGDPGEKSPSAAPEGPSNNATHETTQTFPPRSPAIPPASPSPSPSPFLTSSEVKGLGRQFKKAQDNEYSALKHRQKMEFKELKAAHKAQLSEWESKERDARHKFFAEHKSGPERRTYIQDYTRRREVLLKIQSDEEDRRSREQSVRLDSLKSEQGERLKEFQSYLDRKERPPASLWPN